MEVPVLNMISDFDVGLNDPSFLSLAFAVSGVGKLLDAYSFWKWSDLLLIAFFATFTILITRRIKSLLLRLRNVDVSPTLLCNYDSDSDSFFSTDDDKDNDDEKEVNSDFSVKGSRYYLDDDDEEGINGNIPWMRRCSGSFGDMLSWQDLGGLGSTGVVKLWNHLEINGEGYHGSNAVASFSGKCNVSSLSPAILLAAEKKGSDSVEVSAWDARAGFEIPAFLAEWKQPGGRLVGKMIRIDAGEVDKIYVGDDVGGEIIMGDMRMLNGVVTELTESEITKTVRRERCRSD